MGLWLVDLLTDLQLAAASMRHQLRGRDPNHFQVPFTQLRQAWANHWNRVVRMSAGGAHRGGSMQTGFEMELLPLATPTNGKLTATHCSQVLTRVASCS